MENDEDFISFFEKFVKINSGSLKINGVNEMGKVLEKEFESIGFATSFKELLLNLEQGDHLFCELNKGKIKGKKLLLIGHLDTVFEEDSPFQEFSRKDNIVYGPGVDDMKGGNVIILYV